MPHPFAMLLGEWVGNKNLQYMSNDERISKHLSLLNEAEEGRFENLECPICHHAAVSVWFTHPAADIYRTWFLCANCNFCTRAQNADKPRFFSESRCNKNLEESDVSILKLAVFKRSSQ